MSGAEPATTGRDAGKAEGAGREPDWRRRQRLAEVFGDELPDTTADEREPGDQSSAGRGDAWLRDQVPPHHG